MATFKTFEEYEKERLLNSNVFKDLPVTKFEDDYFARITQNSQPHKAFNTDWDNYNSDQLGKTFLPYIESYSGKESLTFDGAELFIDSPKVENKVLSLTDDGKLFSIAFYTYPKGVKIEQKKSALQLESFEIGIFAEVQKNNTIEIHLKFGDEFKQFLNDYYKKNKVNSTGSASESKTYKITVNDFKRNFSDGMVQFNQMKLLLNLLSIKPHDVATLTIDYLIVKNGKSKNASTIEFEAIVILNDLATNHTVILSIGNKEFEAKWNGKDINKLTEFDCLVEVNLTTVVAYEEIFTLTAKLIFNNDKKVIDSKEMNVKVNADGSVVETDNPVIEPQNVEDSCGDKFKKVAPIILRHEGGYVNNPNDSGGPTNKGITLATFRAYAKEDLNIEPTLDNLKKITEQQATIIYKKRYWEPKGFCDVNNLKVALMIYDWTITSGGAVKQVQKLLVNKYEKDISLDGAFGQQTISAINSIEDQDALLIDISIIRKDYYTDLAYDDNGKKTKNYEFLKGWINRVDDCLNINL